MLIYHGESDSFFWDEHFDFDAGPDAALCIDATEILCAVIVARDQGVQIPDVGCHLQYLRDLCEITADDLPIEDHSNPYWNGL